jgi:mannan endo-1,4-beta-mannosidase
MTAIRTRTVTLVVIALVTGLAGCGPRPGPDGAGAQAERAVLLVDANATPETRALFTNLRRLARDHVLFGHQDDLAYGYGWRAEPGSSDVREVAGSYPAVYGWELGHLEVGAEENLDGVEFARMQDWIVEGFERGGVITISWHMSNPVSGGGAWDTASAVHAILPGGTHHDQYRTWLDTFAEFASSLRSGDRLVPVVFRPFHEMSGSWFWWGARHATVEEFQRLWRFTVEYLRDERGVRNLLYAYSTDVFGSRDEYLARYPGDEYVDVLGFDDYQSVRSPETRSTLVRRMREVVELAESRGKIPAFTETGVERIPDPDWWTGTLLAAIRSDPVAQRIAWVLVWRNGNHEHDRPDHYYAPFPGHPSAADFVRFREDPLILFEDDLPELYRLEAAEQP